MSRGALGALLALAAACANTPSEEARLAAEAGVSDAGSASAPEATDAGTLAVTPPPAPASAACRGTEGYWGSTLEDIVDSACAAADAGIEAAVSLRRGSDGCPETRVDTAYHHSGETLVFAADGTLLRWTNHGDAFLGTSGASCVGGESQCDAFDAPCTVCSGRLDPMHPSCPPSL